ncbi:hypothetical protein CS063_00725 [Sporanaerobium hydrogeniformans]|uniref:Uncharacterized protein n=1 Tax=Sporanaerobium hydrogeniformans TaxID=3072179 RepID=A0AC61DFK5_9FIRM|nr:potassium channel family protein [Sporanaerobium hydrogeniformans]PHV72034.1 hypothetical protein CS063_00725 [Sporanaerobium hydrogeniformans]
MEPLCSLVLGMCIGVEYFLSFSPGPYSRLLVIIKYSMLLLLCREYSKERFYQKINGCIRGGKKLGWRERMIEGLLLLVGLAGTWGASKLNAFLQQNIRQGETLGPYESLFVLVLVPSLVYMGFCIMRLREYKGWLEKNKKKLILGVYLFAWLWFGCLYFYLAQQAQGEYYTFTDTGKRDAVIRGMMQEKAYSSELAFYMNNIVKEGGQEKSFLSLALQENIIYFTEEQIGESWGRFYEQRLVEQGYTHFLPQGVIKNYILNSKAIQDTNYEIKWKKYLGKEYVVVKIALYKLAFFDEERCTYMLDDSRYYAYYKTLKPDKTLILIYTPEEYIINYHNERLRPTHYLTSVLRDSHTLLDREAEEIKEGLESYVYYPLEDFLYFSAVIISTLGLGDITPNDSVVRVFVMLETLFGVVIMGIYVSLIGASQKKE